MVKKKIYYRTQRELEGLQYIAKVMDFGMTLTLTCAFNEMLNAHIMLSSTPMYRHQLKLALKRAERAAELHRRAISYNMRSREFYDNYSDTVIGSADNDITLLRISIKQTLDEAGATHSHAIAYVEVAHTLLGIAKAQFDEVIKSVRTKFGRDYSAEFAEFCPKDVCAEWEKVCRMLYGSIDADLNTPRSVALMEVLCEKFMGGEYVQQSLDEAARHDNEFANEITLSEEKDG